MKIKVQMSLIDQIILIIHLKNEFKKNHLLELLLKYNDRY